MNVERMREFLLGLPDVVETEQFNGIVFWVGDKAIGGKMFAWMHLDGVGRPISWAAGQEHFTELVETEEIEPARYLARAWWVSAERWGVFNERQWQQELKAARDLTLEKLPVKTRKVLALPRAQQRRVVKERRKMLAEKARAAD